ncbi:hypothetical protein ES703_64399 [subsurface metagenome]
MRGSKHNPYECPECGYKTTRKGNLKIHLERVHGLFPFLPERSKKDWVYAQLSALTKKYVKAEMRGDKEAVHDIWDSLISLYSYHRGLFSIEYILEAIAEQRKGLEKHLSRSR